MSEELLLIAKNSIKKITPYKTSRSFDLLNQNTSTKAIILANNESPLPPSKMVFEVIINSLNSLRFYPDPNGLILRQSIANFLSVKNENIILGNGSSEILLLLSSLFCEENTEVVLSEYAYSYYLNCIAVNNAIPIIVPAKNWGHNLDGMLKAITNKTKMIFIANPNNPTGTYVTESELKYFLNKISKNVIVVLDEAYFEYAQVAVRDYPNSLQLQNLHQNLIIIRTFSKAYSLAGLRVGYAILCEKIADLVHRLRLLFNVNSLAQIAAVAALSDTAYLKTSVDLVAEQRSYLLNGMKKLDLVCLPSIANFIAFTSTVSSKIIFNALMKNGIFIRELDNYGMQNYLRVSVGNPEENKKFLDVLEKNL